MAVAEAGTIRYSEYGMDVFTVLKTRNTYKIPGGVGVGLPVVEGSVDAPVEDGSEVGVAVDDDPIEGGVSKVGNGVKAIEASAVAGESSVTRHTIKRLAYHKEYVLLPFSDRALYHLSADTYTLIGLIHVR